MKRQQKKIRIIFLAAILIFAVTDASYARIVEGGGGGAVKSAPASRWDSLKTKVTSWWRSVTNSDGATRDLASEKVTATTLDQAEVSQRAQQLPTYSTAEARKEHQEVLKQDLQVVKDQKDIVETKAGRLGDAALPRSKSGVVTFSLSKKIEKKLKNGKVVVQRISVDSIPLLDVGEEPSLARSEWKIQEFNLKVSAFQDPKALPSPGVVTEDKINLALGAPVEKVIDAKSIKVSVFGPDEKVSLETVRRVVYQIKPEVDVTVYEVKLLSDEEIKLLKAEIILEKTDKCHLATGLLSDLTSSPTQTVRADANYHLTLCLHKMGLFTESIRRMREVIKSGNRDQMGEAIKILVADLPMEFEEEIATDLKKVTDISVVPEGSRDSYHYIIAKASAHQGHFNTAYDNADKVSKKFKRYSEAQFIMAISEYALDKKGKALDRMSNLKKYIDENGGDKNLRALVSINMARMAFQDKRFKDAIQYYLEIRKDHPLWVDALIEQGWTQLQLGDNAGAIGNMYSIHSPYFKSVYQPESFAVRTIGYLGICQYGDAYRTLSQLEQMHRGWLAQMQAYRKTAKTLNHYQTLVKYLNAKNSQVSIDGLPFQVLREMGRHRDFLNIQQAVNNRVDEIDQYGFVNSLIKKDKASVQWLIKKSQERLASYSQKIKKAETNAEFAKDLNNYRRQKSFEEGVLDSLKFELQVYEDSHKHFNQFQKIAGKRVEQRKGDLQMAGGEVLKARLKKLETRLVSILENNELLRYETFAGSGENIRYHATATGQAAKVSEKRMPFTARPENKSLQWQFDGEFWEDEIGNYRSSLKNNCPQNRKISGS